MVDTEELDFIGKWETENDTKGEVTFKLCTFNFGYVVLDGIKVPTFWDKNGNSMNEKLNLKKHLIGDKYEC